jgi:transcriptional regulator with XRE-family HTH domain
MSDIMQRVAEELGSQRARLGMTLEDAARSASVDASRLAAAEEAQTALDEKELQQLAEAYGVDITAFFGGRTTPKEYLFGA